jgi:hypothetical protein
MVMLLLKERRLTSRVAQKPSRIWLGIGSHTSSLCHCRGRGIGKRRAGSKSHSQGSGNSFVGSAVTRSGIVEVVEIVEEGGTGAMIIDRVGGLSESSIPESGLICTLRKIQLVESHLASSRVRMFGPSDTAQATLTILGQLL